MENIVTLNPFADDPLPNAFYYPTRQQDLNEDERKIAIEPERLQYEDDLEQEKLNLRFLKSTHTYQSRLLTTKDEATLERADKFDESWPDSEKPSSLFVPELDVSASKVEAKYRSSMKDANKSKSRGHSDRFMKPERDINHLKSTKKPHSSVNTNGTESTLAKYIDRFRNGTPMSREEREKRRKYQNKKEDDFWWMSGGSRISAPSDSSTPKDAVNGSKTRRRTPRVDEPSKDGTTLSSDVSAKETTSDTLTLNEFMRQEKLKEKCLRRGLRPNDHLNESIWQIQEKADKLLENCSSSMNSSGPVVSTEGLGSTASSCTPRSVVEQPHRPEFTKSALSEAPMPKLKKGGADDILEQWRRRRKVEEMKARAAHGEPVSKTATLMPHNMDLDWKVQAFRRKLQDALGEVTVTPAEANRVPAHSSAMHFTPAPSKVPQVQTQAAIAVQTSLEEKEIPTRDTVSEPALPRRNPSIASPHLAGPVNSRVSVDVEPHLHLSCDIIPCPHNENPHRSRERSHSSRIADRRDDRKHIERSRGVHGHNRKKHNSSSRENQNDHLLNQNNNSKPQKSSKEPGSGQNIHSQFVDDITSPVESDISAQQGPVLSPPTHVHHGVSDVSFEQLKAKHLRSLRQEHMRFVQSEPPTSTDEESQSRQIHAHEVHSEKGVQNKSSTWEGKREKQGKNRALEKHQSRTDRDRTNSNARNCSELDSHSGSIYKKSNRSNSMQSQNDPSVIDDFHERHDSGHDADKRRSEHTAHKANRRENRQADSNFSRISDASVSNVKSGNSGDENRSSDRDQIQRKGKKQRSTSRGQQQLVHSDESHNSNNQRVDAPRKASRSHSKELPTRTSVDSLTDVTELEPNLSSSFAHSFNKSKPDGKSGQQIKSASRSNSLQRHAESDNESCPRSSTDFKQRDDNKGNARRTLSENRAGRETSVKRKDARDDVRPPQGSTSPVRSLGSTITNVVGNRLFTSSLTQVSSSFDDSFQATPTPLELARAASKRQHQSKTKYQTKGRDGDEEGGSSQDEGGANPALRGAGEDTPASDVENKYEKRSIEEGQSAPDEALDDDIEPMDLESALLSDEEEFSDDDILRDLRRRRLYHIQRLKAVDKLLTEKTQSVK